MSDIKKRWCVANTHSGGHGADVVTTQTEEEAIKVVTNKYPYLKFISLTVTPYRDNAQRR